MGESVGLGVVGLLVRIDGNRKVWTQELRVQLKTELQGFAAVVRLNHLAHKTSDH